MLSNVTLASRNSRDSRNCTYCVSQFFLLSAFFSAAAIVLSFLSRLGLRSGEDINLIRSAMWRLICQPLVLKKSRDLSNESSYESSRVWMSRVILDSYSTWLNSFWMSYRKDWLEPDSTQLNSSLSTTSVEKEKFVRELYSWWYHMWIVWITYPHSLWISQICTKLSWLGS